MENQRVSPSPLPPSPSHNNGQSLLPAQPNPLTKAPDYTPSDNPASLNDNTNTNGSVSNASDSHEILTLPSSIHNTTHSNIDLQKSNSIDSAANLQASTHPELSIESPPHSLADTDTDTDTSNPGADPNGEKPKTKLSKPNLTDEQRTKIYELLYHDSLNGRIPRGLLGKLAAQFNVTNRTIARIWTRGQESLKRGLSCADVTSLIQSQTGRKPKDLDLSSIGKLHPTKRKSLASLAKHTNIPKSTWYRAVKRNLIMKDEYYRVVKPVKETKKYKRRYKGIRRWITVNETTDDVGNQISFENVNRETSDNQLKFIPHGEKARR